jgi:hypothetical protein
MRQSEKVNENRNLNPTRDFHGEREKQSYQRPSKRCHCVARLRDSRPTSLDQLARPPPGFSNLKRDLERNQKINFFLYLGTQIKALILTN